MRNGRLLPGWLDALLAVDGKTALADQRAGIAGEMAAPGHTWPDGGVEGSLDPGGGTPLGDHVLQVPQSSLGAQDPVGFGQRGPRVRD